MRYIMMAACLLLSAGPAFAHAFLKTATPAVGSTVAAPSQVVIAFTEAVEPRFSTIVVQDDAQSAMQTGDIRLVDAKSLAIGVKALPPGHYKVTWHVTATDTHKTEGSFTFTVTP